MYRNGAAVFLGDTENHFRIHCLSRTVSKYTIGEACFLSLQCAARAQKLNREYGPEPASRLDNAQPIDHMMNSDDDEEDED